ncbi:calcium-binding protein P-like [Erpetoichthys calabaricus]|uniref:calcium-binding protein P-like n=1 Tax=Erpetoichthys calabaricus TaxID=27687 RepID=UPI00109FE6EC|nr:calcium-binding protein P-like [Erpetoichthys calabaricus]
MKAVILLICALGTTWAMPLQVYQQMQQQIQLQQQPQHPGVPALATISQEMMRDIARYKSLMQQYPELFHQVNFPDLQPGPPMNPAQQLPQVPHGQAPSMLPPQQPSQVPSQVPSQLPPQLPPQLPSVLTPPLNPQLPPQMPPHFQLIEAQPGWEQQYEYDAPYLLAHGPSQQSPALPTAGNVPVPATPQAPVVPGQQAQQPGQGTQFNQPGQTPSTQGHLPVPTGQQPQMFPTFGFVPVIPPQTAKQQQFSGYGLLLPAPFPPQPVQPGLEQQPPQQQPSQSMFPQLVYFPLQTGVMAGAIGSVSSEEMQQSAGDMSPPMAGFIPGFATPTFGGGFPNFVGSGPAVGGTVPVAGGIPTAQGTQPGVLPEVKLPIPVGQGGSPTIPEVIPVGQGNMPPKNEGAVPAQGGQQPSPQMKLPNMTPDGVPLDGPVPPEGTVQSFFPGSTQDTIGKKSPTAAPDPATMPKAQAPTPPEVEMPDLDDYTANFYLHP